jgi:hypothetical protein
MSAAEDFAAELERALAAEDFAAIADDTVSRVMTALVKFYAAKAEATGGHPALIAADRVTPTEVVVASAELIRAANLNLFDLSMWLSRVR